MTSFKAVILNASRHHFLNPKIPVIPRRLRILECCCDAQFNLDISPTKTSCIRKTEINTFHQHVHVLLFNRYRLCLFRRVHFFKGLRFVENQVNQFSQNYFPTTATTWPIAAALGQAREELVFAGTSRSLNQTNFMLQAVMNVQVNELLTIELHKRRRDYLTPEDGQFYSDVHAEEKYGYFANVGIRHCMALSGKCVSS